MVSCSIETILRVLKRSEGPTFVCHETLLVGFPLMDLRYLVSEGSAGILGMFSYSVLIKQYSVADSHPYSEHRPWVRIKLKGTWRSSLDF